MLVFLLAACALSAGLTPAEAVTEAPARCHVPKSTVNESPDLQLRFPAFGQNAAWRDLDLFLPRGGPTGPNGKFPIIIWVHGGGWNDFDQTIGVTEGLLNRLDAGWAIASVDFRTPCENNNTNTHPTQILDIYTATIWLREVLLPQLTAHNLDPDRLLLAGGSSGSHLATLAGLAANQTYLAPRLPYMGIMSLYGIYDLAGVWIEETVTDSAGVQTRRWPTMARGSAYLLGCDEWIEDCTIARRAAGSPKAYLDAQDPPMLIMHGSNDQFVDYNHVGQFYDALSAVRGLPSGNPTDQFRSNGTDSFFSLRSTHRLDLDIGGCVPFASGQLEGGDHGCIQGDGALAVQYLTWLGNAHANY